MQGTTQPSDSTDHRIDRPQERTSIRVLHLLKGLGPGGAELLVASAARVRKADEFDYDVAYILPWKNAAVASVLEAGASVHCLSCADVRDPRWVWRLIQLIRRTQPDVLHLHSPLPAAMARPAVRMLPRTSRPAVVSTEHNMWSSHNAWTRRANALTLRFSDVLLAVSDEVGASVDPAYGRQVEVVVQGLVLDDVEDAARERAVVRRELGVSPDEVVAVTVANLRPSKAYPDLLTAASIVRRLRPHVRFLAVGQGPLEDELRSLHREMDLGSNFTFLGYRPDVLRILAGGDMFVLASHFEGYPIAVMEAMAMGLPVVATNVGGMPQATGTGERGLLVEPGRPNDLAEAVIRLSDDAALRAVMSGRSKEFARRYDIRTAVERTEDIYRKLVDARA